MFSIACQSPSGQMVYTVRQRCGRQLALEAPTDADVVSTVPESATPAALGYAQQVCVVHRCEEMQSPPDGTLSSQSFLLSSFRSPGCRTSRFCARIATLEGRLFSQTPV